MCIGYEELALFELSSFLLAYRLKEPATKVAGVLVYGTLLRSLKVKKFKLNK
jgi:hypothetical protein